MLLTKILLLYKMKHFTLQAFKLAAIFETSHINGLTGKILRVSIYCELYYHHDLCYALKVYLLMKKYE
jgi:hypothetical protein